MADWLLSSGLSLAKAPRHNLGHHQRHHGEGDVGDDEEDGDQAGGVETEIALERRDVASRMPPPTRTAHTSMAMLKK